MLPKLRAKWRRNQIKNRERKNLQKASLRNLDPEKFRMRNRESQKRCWPKRQAYARAYYQKNKERLKERALEIYASNKLRAYNYAQKRRALKQQATINLKSILAWVKRVRKQSMAVCYYCQKHCLSGDIHFDHIVPLSKGGAHSVENLCVSCATCNLTKKAKPIHAWIRIGQQIFSL